MKLFLHQICLAVGLSVMQVSDNTAIFNQLAQPAEVTAWSCPFLDGRLPQRKIGTNLILWTHFSENFVYVRAHKRD